MFNRKLKKRIELLECQVECLERSYNSLPTYIGLEIIKHEKMVALSKLKPMSTVYILGVVHGNYFHEYLDGYVPVKFVRLNLQNASALIMNEKEQFADVSLANIYIDKPETK